MKTYLKAIVQETCMITTCIVIILALGEQSESYENILQTKYFFPTILFLSFTIALTSQLFSLWKTENVLYILGGKLLHILVIICIVLCFGALLHWFDATDPITWLSISIEVLIIYGFVSYFSYQRDQKEALGLSEQLNKYKNNLHQDKQ